MMAGQFLIFAGFMIYAAWDLGAIAIGLAVLFSLWMGSVSLMAVGYSTWPERFPMLRAREKPGWRLRMRHVESVAQQLRDLGFEEVGVKIERTLLIAIPTREFWHPEHRTFASLSAQMFAPKISFMTKGKAGTILYSGRSMRSRQRTVVSRLLAGASVCEQFEDHLRAIRGEEMVPAMPPTEKADYREHATPGAAELREWRLELTREWYVATFGTDEQWETWQATRRPTKVRAEKLAPTSDEEDLSSIESSVSSNDI